MESTTPLLMAGSIITATVSSPPPRRPTARPGLPATAHIVFFAAARGTSGTLTIRYRSLDQLDDVVRRLEGKR